MQNVHSNKCTHISIYIYIFYKTYKEFAIVTRLMSNVLYNTMHAIANILLRKSAAASICCTVFFSSAFSSFSTYLDFVGDLAHWMDRRRRTHWDHQSRHWLHYIRSYWSCRQTADWRLERRSCTRHNSRRLTAKMEKEN